MALVIPVADSAAILLPLLMVCDVFAVAHYRKHFHRRSVKLLLPGAAIGIGIGALFFGYFSSNERVLQIGLGVLSLFFIAFQALRAMITGALAKRHPHSAEGVFMGAIAGFTSTIAHAGGPPTTIYLLPQQLPRDLFVGTTVILFCRDQSDETHSLSGIGYLARRTPRHNRNPIAPELCGREIWAFSSTSVSQTAGLT